MRFVYFGPHRSSVQSVPCKLSLLIFPYPPQTHKRRDQTLIGRKFGNWPIWRLKYLIPRSMDPLL